MWDFAVSNDSFMDPQPCVETGPVGFSFVKAAARKMPGREEAELVHELMPREPCEETQLQICCAAPFFFAKQRSAEVSIWTKKSRDLE